LGCGTGRVLLPLLAAGHAVEGLDGSADMLRRCREFATARGLAPVLHQGDMAAFALARRFRTIFSAVATLSLLGAPGLLESALACARAHLLPGGRIAIAMDRPRPQPVSAVLARDVLDPDDGTRRRCLLEPLPAPWPGVERWRMVNEVLPRVGEPLRETSVIDFRRLAPDVLAGLLGDAGFGKVRVLGPQGEAEPDPSADGYLATAVAA
jgi:SAM-dependent methyltransferase